MLIAGGTSGTAARREVLRFDPADGTVRRLAILPEPVTHASAAALGGRLYVVGGRGDALDSARAAIVSVDPSGRVARAGRLPVPLSDTGAATLGGRIVVVGGRDARGAVHDEVRVLEPRP